MLTKKFLLIVYNIASHSSLEGGENLRYIQKILVHKSSQTTEIYTHVTSKALSGIKSPFDSLNIEEEKLE